MKKARWLGSSSPFSSADLVQTGLLRHPQAGALGALEGSRLGALQALGALSGHFRGADRPGAQAHGGDLLALGIAGHVGFLGRLQGADQGLFLDGHHFLHSLELLSFARRQAIVQALCQTKKWGRMALGERRQREINNLQKADQVQRRG